MNASNILALMGGLGLFLLGMNQMSDGIEKAAGAKLRSILEAFTKNRLLGMIVVLYLLVLSSHHQHVQLWLYHLLTQVL